MDKMKTGLTASQLSLWAGHKMHPGVPLLNTAYTFELSGKLHISHFRKAFQKLIDATDAFRMLYFEEDGIPYQTLGKLENFEMEVIDFSAESDQTGIINYLRKRSQQRIEIEKRIFDTALLRVSEEHYIWFLNMHHLVTDVVSFKIIFARMGGYYRDFENNTAFESLDVPSYLDYIRATLAEQEDQKEEANSYWRDKIDNLSQTPALYGTKTGADTTASTRVSVPLGPDRSTKLRAIANIPEVRSWTEHLSLFNILISLLHVYLYRVSGQKELAVGAPSHNRTTRKFQEVVGYLIEIFPLAIRIKEGDTFFSVLQRIKLEANDYIRYAQQAGITPEISGSFNVVLNYIPTGFSDFSGIETKVRWIHPDHMDSSHQLRCHVVDFDAKGEIVLLFDLNHASFNKTLRKRAPQHFLQLMDAMLDDMHKEIDRPSLIGEEERKALLVNPAPKFTTESVLRGFEEIVTFHGPSVALRSGDRTMDYETLNKKANQLANYMQDSGVRSGEKLGLYFFRGENYVVSVLASLKLGATFVPIPSDLPITRMDYILKNSDCSLLLTESALKAKTSDLDILTVDVDTLKEDIAKAPVTYQEWEEDRDSIAYTLYTSGSTGMPKGVMIPMGALNNYLSWARNYYANGEAFNFPFFTSIGFDLTITSLFLPLITGGELVIYRESGHGPDLSLMQVLDDNKVNAIKLTPSHLSFIGSRDLSSSKIRTVIVGGEDFKTGTAGSIFASLGGKAVIYNEYGPTEATVGCVVCAYDKSRHNGTSVPIGKPIDNMKVYVLDAYKNLVPVQVTGELYLSGPGLSAGYANMEQLTKEKFVDNPFLPGTKMYYTGDLVRWNGERDLEYLGRIDEQVKLSGFRIELADIEANLSNHPDIDTAAVVVMKEKQIIPESEIINCSECGLPSNYPNADFDEGGICHLCNAFKGYKEKTDKYFKTEEQLRKLLTSKKGVNESYDCLSLLSGGKDSTYILAKLVNMGLRVLAFTLDNGYISDQAKTNINKIVKKLGVDHMYGETPHMNKIFVDSLHRHQNVCNGCFKTIYTLSTKVALDKNIPFVVTGLSRGQFFETRLTEELFWDETISNAGIDRTILEARKLYHQEEDAVKQLLDVSMFHDESTFTKVQFVDFYRYSDVSLGEMLHFLKENVDWVRPTDTGRSTNCLINQLGIYVHKKEKGYSNYSFPYSWDVRLGHKTREETLEEINEYIDETEVKRIMKEIGYEEMDRQGEGRKRLVGYYTGKVRLSSMDLNRYLSEKIPQFMIPSVFKHLEELPLTGNGKVNKAVLRSLNEVQLEMDTPFVAPGNEIEELLEGIWKEVMGLSKIGVYDNFIALGGHSLAAIRVTTRINDELGMNFPLNKIFELPTISDYAKFIEETLEALMQ